MVLGSDEVVRGAPFYILHGGLAQHPQAGGVHEVDEAVAGDVNHGRQGFYHEAVALLTGAQARRLFSDHGMGLAQRVVDLGQFVAAGQGATAGRALGDGARFVENAGHPLGDNPVQHQPEHAASGKQDDAGDDGVQQRHMHCFVQRFLQVQLNQDDRGLIGWPWHDDGEDPYHEFAIIAGLYIAAAGLGHLFH